MQIHLAKKLSDLLGIQPGPVEDVGCYPDFTDCLGEDVE